MFSDLFSKRYGLRATPEGLRYEDVPQPAMVGLYHEELIMNCQWSQFYDICELLWQALKYKGERDNLSDEVNSLFGEEHMGFKLRDGKVEKIGSGFIDAQIDEVIQKTMHIGETNQE